MKSEVVWTDFHSDSLTEVRTLCFGADLWKLLLYWSQWCRPGWFWSLWCWPSWFWSWCWRSARTWSVVRVWKSSSGVLSVWTSSLNHLCYSVDTPTAGMMDEWDTPVLTLPFLSSTVLSSPVQVLCALHDNGPAWSAAVSCVPLCCRRGQSSSQRQFGSNY